MRGQLGPDHAIARLAAARHGVVSREELVALGIGVAAIDHRVRAGRLHRVHRGVYAVGHGALAREGRWLAAVLACGPGAALSHASAATAWDLTPAAAGPIDVTVRRSGRWPRPAIRIHRSQTLADRDIAGYRSIPITTPARTLLDLAAAGLRGRRLERALDRAQVLQLDVAGLHEALSAHPQRPGAGALRALLSRYTPGSAVTRSELEERFLALCDRHGIPRPKVNTLIEGMEVDFLWPRARLVVEVDGYAYHHSPAALDADRSRDVTLVLAGYRVLRFTWRQVTNRPKDAARAVERALWPR